MVITAAGRICPISTTILTGSCDCDAVRFGLSAPLIGALYCHCTRCQKRTGAAVQASARVAVGSLTITNGEAELRDWTPPGGLGKSFCGICGSHQFVAYAAPWEEIGDDGLPRFDERLPAQ